MKKIVLIIGLICFLTVNCCAITINSEDISAKSAVLMDGDTGQIIFSKNLNEELKMASTTKIMTAILALEYGNLEQIIEVPKEATLTEGSSMYLKAGEKIKFGDIVYGLMLNSGNDAALAIAYHISGSVEEFAKKMNEKAKELELKNTNFENPNGLDSDNHYTSAYDLALITKYAISKEEFLKITSTKSKVVETVEGEKKYLKNHNKMLEYYELCDGVKTGFTKKAGRSLVTTAKKDNLRLIAVTLNAPDDWNDHKKMLDFGFDNFMKLDFCKKDEILINAFIDDGDVVDVPLKVSKDFYKIINKNNLKNYRTELRILDNTKAPIKEEQELGQLYIYENNFIIEKIPLLSTMSVKKIYEKKNLIEYFKLFYQSL